MFGIWNNAEAANVIYFGLHALQHRGQEGAGIITSSADSFVSHRGTGLLSEVFKEPKNLEKLVGRSGIGDVRYSPEQTNNLTNVQPFLFEFNDLKIAIAATGNVTNSQTLRHDLEDAGAVFHANSDSETLIHLIRHSKKTTFYEQLDDALLQLRGGFNFTILTKDALIGVVDPNCFRPLVLGQMPNGSYILASETCGIYSVGAEFIRNIHAGTYVVINDDGYHIHTYNEDIQVTIEAMEYIYFARPDSDIAGINIHSARKSLGAKLAEEAPCPQADMVVGVPNSSLSAATGYAERAGLPYEMGLIKNQYVGRTFIQPTQALREQGVRKKLSAVGGVVQGKSIVLIDDSIVRGTTSKRLIILLREAGAKEIHLRIACPPLRFPSFYGIDMSTNAELIAANHTVDEICDIIGCDSLAFLSVEGMIDGIGTDFDTSNKGLSVDAFTGYYPADLGDYKEGFESQLTDIQKRVLRGENVDG